MLRKPTVAYLPILRIWLHAPYHYNPVPKAGELIYIDLLTINDPISYEDQVLKTS